MGELNGRSEHSLDKSNQQLRLNLKEAASPLKWSAVDLMQKAVRLSEARQENEAWKLLKIATSYKDVVDRLRGYADEVKVGRIKGR